VYKPPDEEIAPPPTTSRGGGGVTASLYFHFCHGRSQREPAASLYWISLTAVATMPAHCLRMCYTPSGTSRCNATFPHHRQACVHTCAKMCNQTAVCKGSTAAHMLQYHEHNTQSRSAYAVTACKAHKGARGQAGHESVPTCASIATPAVDGDQACLLTA
jgi:hypothetical protein